MVLARYNQVGKATATLVAAGALILPLAAAVVWLNGGSGNGPVLALLGLVWLATLPGLAGALRAVANIMGREGRAVFIEDGRLHYVAPGMPGSLNVAAAEIAHARVTQRQRQGSTPQRTAQNKPVFVVEVGRVSGRPRDIAVYALDVSPETLAAAITAFAAGKAPAGMAQAIVR